MLAVGLCSLERNEKVSTPTRRLSQRSKRWRTPDQKEINVIMDWVTQQLRYNSVPPRVSDVIYYARKIKCNLKRGVVILLCNQLLILIRQIWSYIMRCVIGWVVSVHLNMNEGGSSGKHYMDTVSERNKERKLEESAWFLLGRVSAYVYDEFNKQRIELNKEEQKNGNYDSLLHENGLISAGKTILTNMVGRIRNGVDFGTVDDERKEWIKALDLLTQVRETIAQL